MAKEVALMGKAAQAAAQEEETSIYRDFGFGAVMAATGALITYGVMRYRDQQKTDDFHRIWSEPIQKWRLQVDRKVSKLIPS